MTTPTPAQTNNVMVKDYGADVCSLHGEHVTLLTSIRDGTDHVLNQSSSNQGHVLNALHTDANNILRSVGETGNHLLNQSSVISNRISDIGEKNLVSGKDSTQLLTAGQCGISKDICSATRDVLQELCRVNNNVDRSIDSFRAQSARDHSDTLVGLKDVQTETLRARAAIEKDICETKGFLDMQVLKTKCDIERQAAENFAAIQLEACKNKDALALQMAECCCEIKQKIEQRYNDTVEVIKDLNLQNVRDELAQARQDLLVVRLGGVGVGIGPLKA